MQCEPCGKSFTGPACYNQHLESEKHKKRILSLGLLNGTPVKSTNVVVPIPQSSKFLECAVCVIQFDSFENFQKHSISAEHAQKVIKKNTESSSCLDVVSSSNSSLNYEENNANKNESVDENDRILSLGQEFKSQFLSFSACNTCNKHFSGPEPYKQHMESATHKKKVELEKQSVAGKDQNVVSFTCDPCRKMFSGQVPYVQHMNSEMHKKKIQSLKFLENSSSEVDASTGMKVSNIEENNLKEKTNIPWFCEICEKQCSGLIPYQQHLNGMPHMKMVKVKQQQSSFKSEDSVELVLQQHHANEKQILNKTFLNMPHLLNVSNQHTNKDNQMMITDPLLPGIMSNLNTVSTDELGESIKIFLPDDNIDFDNYENKRHANSANDKIVNVLNEIPAKKIREEPEISQGLNKNDIADVIEKMHIDEAKEKSEIYQVCNICNVEMQSLGDVLPHYDSLDHFCKKWNSN